MEREEIKCTLYEMMSELLEREVDDIDESKALMDELDLSSLEIMTMIADLEEQFQIQIPENDIRGMVTVGDMIDFIYEAKKEC
ncbi:MAG: acyl carrier protein [Lachnospiraceae bacterium]|nr:acyl carrier protein [Lachnospiraceae bacterium]MEE1258489.1 phosphopantetheine-binding protein [Lachnospiraceae bacterium]